MYTFDEEGIFKHQTRSAITGITYKYIKKKRKIIVRLKVNLFPTANLFIKSTRYNVNTEKRTRV